jgi:hypothetical protein
MERYNIDSKYYGRVSPLEILVGRELQFSGFGNLSGGCTILGGILFIWTCVSAWFKLLLYQFQMLLYFFYSTFFSPHLYT